MHSLSRPLAASRFVRDGAAVVARSRPRGWLVAAVLVAGAGLLVSGDAWGSGPDAAAGACTPEPAAAAAADDDRSSSPGV